MNTQCKGSIETQWRLDGVPVEAQWRFSGGSMEASAGPLAKSSAGRSAESWRGPEVFGGLWRF